MMALTPVRPLPPISEKEMKRVATINALAIQAEYIELPSTLDRLAERKVELAKAKRIAELEAEVTEKKIRKELREKNDAEVAAAVAGGDTKAKRWSEDRLDDEVVLDPRYRASQESLIEAEYQVEMVADRALKVLSAKRDMLISLGADERQNKEGIPSIRAERR